MKQLVQFFLLLVLLSSCTTETTGESTNNEEVERLQNELNALQSDIEEKDALLNESIATFNEIQENVAKISLKEQEIRLRSGDANQTPDQKAWILEELKHINFLREENIRKINNLNKQLKDRDVKITELQTMVNRLADQVQSQEDLIASLQTELADMDREYSKLFDAYLEQSQLAVETMKELNKVFYVYGTLDELKQNNVVVQEGGFIGIGKKAAIKDGFNEDYFTAADKHKLTKITVVGKKLRMISDHPSNSFKIEDKGGSKVIQITKPNEFWKISKYLVVIVD
jgi:predicted  nucleic acid-binding Zn-ribbon protein